MQPPEKPLDEIKRLRVLRTLNILDTPPEERFDRLTRMAQQLLGTPIALVTLVDEARQWFKSRQGLDIEQTARDISFCGHAILGDELFVVKDASRDPRFSDNPLVRGEPHIRFYAGRPLKSIDGSKLGTLCVIDHKPRELRSGELQFLEDLAKLVERELNTEELAGALGISKEIERRLADILDNVEDMIQSVDPQGRFLYVNQAWRKLLGYDDADISNLTIFDILHPDSLGHCKDAFRRVSTGERLKGIRASFVAKDGRRLELEGNINPKMAGGKIVSTRAVFRDISMIIRAEKALAQVNADLERRVQERTLALVEANEKLSAENNERLRTERALRERIAFEALVTSLSTHFILLKPEDIDAGIDKALGRLGEFAGVDRCYIFEFFKDGSLMSNTYEWCAPGIDSQRQNLQELPANTFPWFERRIKKPEVVYVPRVKDLPAEARLEKEEFYKESIQSIICAPMLLSGRVVGFLGFDSVKREVEWDRDSIALLKIVGEMFVNVLERKRSEQALASSQEQLRRVQRLESIGRLAGGVAHDFNNVISVILGISEINLEQIKDGGTLREDLQEIRDAGKRAMVLTRQLLAFSRKQVLQPTVLYLNRLAADISRMLERLIGADIELVMKPGAQGNVFADAGQMEQVIMNLVINARDAMPKGGKVCIATEDVKVEAAQADKFKFPMRPGSYVRLSVSDTGTGMSEGILSNIFEPFFTTKEPGKGTGLGLATVYGIVKQSEGFIDVESRLGEGTTFRIYLPKTEKVAVTTEPETPGKSIRGSETVLIVEDDAPVRRLAGRVLTDYGYKVLEAEDGESALSLLKDSRGRVDLALCDIVMPGMRGVDLAKKIRKAFPRVRVMLMTGYADKSLLDLDYDGEHWQILQKPFTAMDLTGRVRSVLDRKTGV